MTEKEERAMSLKVTEQYPIDNVTKRLMLKHPNVLLGHSDHYENK